MAHLSTSSGKPNDYIQSLIQLKLIVLGDSGVGKSSLVERYISDIFKLERPTTINCDIKHTTIRLPDDAHVRLEIWDTAGQERYRYCDSGRRHFLSSSDSSELIHAFPCCSVFVCRQLTRNYYRKAVGVVLVYDVRQPASLDSLDDWWEELDIFCDSHRDRLGRQIKLPLMVVANKMDQPVGQPFGLECFCFPSSTPQQL